jgi:hypothetical protein
MRKLIILLIIGMALPGGVYSFSGLGSGTEEDPYQITNVHQLQEMNDDLSAHYILMNDIDASETREWNVGDHDGNPETPDSAMGFEPVGKYSFKSILNSFGGELYGQEYTITNLYINRPNQGHVGLFGCVSNNASISNLYLKKTSITGSDTIGTAIGLIYANKDNTKIIVSNCHTQGNLTGQVNVGGFIGINWCENGEAIIRNCSSETIISSYKYTGGFCGKQIAGGGETRIQNCTSNSTIFIRLKNNKYDSAGFCAINYSASGNAIITECSSKGNIKAESDVAGFCFLNKALRKSSSVITKCKTDISINAYESIAGFCFENNALGNEAEALISICHSSGDVIGSNSRSIGLPARWSGGFVGRNLSSSQATAMIKNCFSTGSSRCRVYSGGFCSHNISNSESSQSIIENCYSIGKVLGWESIGGFCGLNENPNDGHIISSYWDTQTSGLTESDGGEGKTTAEMMMQSTFVDWDFDDVWCIVEGMTYPQLQHFVDCDTLVSVPEIMSNEEIEIYPNPANDIIQISANEFIERIKIVNLLGNVVKEINPKGFTKELNISVEDLPEGVYFVILYVEKGFITKKIIIQKGN